MFATILLQRVVKTQISLVLVDFLESTHMFPTILLQRVVKTQISLVLVDFLRIYRHVCHYILLQMVSGFSFSGFGLFLGESTHMFCHYIYTFAMGCPYSGFSGFE